jgi:type VI secretion system protein ImpA
LTGTIDLERLLSVFSKQAPAGPDLEYDPLFGEMERSATTKEEQQFGDTIIPAQEPDWRELKKISLQVLEQSKDLRAAVYLTRALIHTDGFAGLADGVSLIKGFLEQYWETLHPLLDPDDNNDPTIRINTLINLCDPIDYLAAINRIPLVTSAVAGKFCYRDILVANASLEATDSDPKELSIELIEAAFRDSQSEDSAKILTQVTLSIECLSAIETRLNELVGIEQSPDLNALSQLLEQIRQALAKYSHVDSNTEQFNTSGNDALRTPKAPPEATSGSINNRDDVLRMLDRINHYYKRQEPSSPVPLLLERAKRLVNRDFHEIVQDLAPGGLSHFDFLWTKDDN